MVAFEVVVRYRYQLDYPLVFEVVVHYRYHIDKMSDSADDYPFQHALHSTDFYYPSSKFPFASAKERTYFVSLKWKKHNNYCVVQTMYAWIEKNLAELRVENVCPCQVIFAFNHLYCANALGLSFKVFVNEFPFKTGYFKDTEYEKHNLLYVATELKRLYYDFFGGDARFVDCLLNPRWMKKLDSFLSTFARYEFHPYRNANATILKNNGDDDEEIDHLSIDRGLRTPDLLEKLKERTLAGGSSFLTRSGSDEKQEVAKKTSNTRAKRTGQYQHLKRLSEKERSDMILDYLKRDYLHNMKSRLASVKMYKSKLSINKRSKERLKLFGRLLLTSTRNTYAMLCDRKFLNPYRGDYLIQCIHGQYKRICKHQNGYRVVFVQNRCNDEISTTVRICNLCNKRI